MIRKITTGANDVPTRSFPIPARAFSLLELIVSIVAVVTVGAAIAPAMASMRGEGHNAQSQANLMEIGQGRDQYAADNKDRIFTYTWRAGESYTLPTGQTRIPVTYQEAAALQNQEILMRRTGRINGVFKILSNDGRLPHRRYSHLALMDYMAGDDDGAFVSSRFADPADGDLLNWQQRQLDYGPGSSVPYVGEVRNGYDQNSSWSDRAILQRWAFASSYQVVPFSWQGDGPDNVYIPTSSSPHLFVRVGDPDLSGRYLSEVAFPAQKVHMFEEFDREQKRFPYFAYNIAISEKLMFDGSINSQPSRQANDSVNPAQPDVIWKQRYVPLDTFPIPLGGFGDSSLLNMRYRWTEGGLQGVDYD